VVSPEDERTRRQRVVILSLPDTEAPKHSPQTRPRVHCRVRQPCVLQPHGEFVFATACALRISRMAVQTCWFPASL
jgi:hypothetical protein